MDKQRKLQRNEIIDRIFIGRICQGVAAEKRIILDSPSASRDHAVIDRTATHLRITDTSKNGTWVNVSYSSIVVPGQIKDQPNGSTVAMVLLHEKEEQPAQATQPGSCKESA